MSNDLIVSLKNQLAALPGQLDEMTKAVAGINGPVSKRISIEGGVFRKIAGGKEVGVIEDRHMNVIFVNASPTPSRTYYEQAYQKGVKISPVCWSSNAKTPDPEVKAPKAASCDQCPFGVKGSGQGGKGTACRRAWRAAVVLPNDPAGDVMQLVIPDKSIWGEEDSGRWPWKAYSRMLANNNISLGYVITKMQFDTKESAPRLLFSPAGVVNADDIPTLQNQAKTDAAQRAIKLTVYQFEAKDSGAVEDDEPIAPAFSAAPPVAQSDVIPEPVLRESAKSEAPDMADTIKKWAAKKK